MSGINPNILRAVATFCIALAAVLNGKYDAQTIGELVLALVAILTIVQAQLNAHAAKPADETHPTPAPVGEP